jgi:hypothetical protein
MSSSSNCVDCGVDICPDSEKRNGRRVRNGRNGRWEHYMALPEIWKAAGMGVDDGYMCIGCLEGRIGRELTGGLHQCAAQRAEPLECASAGSAVARTDEREAI